MGNEPRNIDFLFVFDEIQAKRGLGWKKNRFLFGKCGSKSGFWPKIDAENIIFWDLGMRITILGQLETKQSK